MSEILGRKEYNIDQPSANVRTAVPGFSGLHFAGSTQVKNPVESETFQTASNLFTKSETAEAEAWTHT